MTERFENREDAKKTREELDEVGREVVDAAVTVHRGLGE